MASPDEKEKDRRVREVLAETQRLSKTLSTSIDDLVDLLRRRPEETHDAR